MNKYTFRFTALFTILLLIVFFTALINSWFGISNGTGNDFCEAAREGFVLQPINTYSNIGFILSGLYCAWYLSNTKIIKKNVFFTNNVIPKFYCCVVVLLGPCSMAMHATEASLGGLFDMNSMYLFSGFMFTYAITRFYKLSSFVFIFTYLFCIIFCNIAGQYRTVFGFDFYAGSASFGLFCALGILFEWLNYKRKKINIQFKYAVYCSLTFLTAFGVWHFGKTGHCFCNPYSLFQWHGVWHLLCGLSTYFLFKYYISEDTEKR